MSDFEKKMEKDVKGIIGGFLDNIHQDNMNLANSFSDNESVGRAVEAIKNGNPDGFYFNLIYPLSNFVDGLINTQTDNERVLFIFKHTNYVQAQFRKLIEQYEGWGCSADKTKNIMEALVSYYMTDKKIVWNLDSEYTYGIPKKVFTTHDEIVNFFEGVYFLYYGRPEKYLVAYSEVVLKQTNLNVEEE